MNKEQMIEAIAERQGLTLSVVKLALEGMADVVCERVREGAIP